MNGPLTLTACAATLLCLWPPRSAAHEIPSDVTIQAFLKPEGQRLHLLLRVPLAALRDVDYPKRGPGYLDLARVDAALREAAHRWIAGQLELYEDETLLGRPEIAAIRVSLPADPSFASYEEAVAHVRRPPLPSETELYWSQAMLDVLLEYPIRSEGSRFSVCSGLGRLGSRVTTALRLLPPGSAVRAFEWAGDPGLVRLDPRWHQAALHFVTLGLSHILDGIDHLLFLLCLVIPFRRLGALVWIVTSFTVAHSITLVASASGLAPDAPWFPPLIEMLIAVSIVYMALENIVKPGLHRRWMIAFGFGLVHGFGFSFGLQQTLQFAGSHLLTSLLAFNAGVELGQLLVLALLVPALHLLFRSVPERIGTILLSALAAHTGWHWMAERFDRLRRFPFQWPAFDAALLASGTRWLMLALIAGGLLWLVFGALWQRSRGPRDEPTP